MAAYQAYEFYEYFDMIVCYGAASEDPRRAAAIYREKYPERTRFPSFRVIKQVCERARETGKLMPNRERAGRKCAIPLELQELVVEHIDKDRHLSIRKLAKRFMTPNHVICSILEKHGFVFNDALNHYIKLDKPRPKRSILELKKKPKGPTQPKLNKTACVKFLMELEEQNIKKEDGAETQQIKSEEIVLSDVDIDAVAENSETTKVEARESKKIQLILPKLQNNIVISETVMSASLNGNKLLKIQNGPNLSTGMPQIIKISPKPVVQESQLNINKPQIVTPQTLIKISPESFNQEQLKNKPQVIQLSSNSLLKCVQEQQVNNNKPQIIQISPKPLTQELKPQIGTPKKLIPISPKIFKQDQKCKQFQIIQMLPCSKVDQKQLKGSEPQIITAPNVNNLLTKAPSQLISPQQNLKNVVFINGTLYQLAPTTVPGPLSVLPQQNNAKNIITADVSTNKIVKPALILLPKPTTVDPTPKPQLIRIKLKPESNQTNKVCDETI